MQLATGKPRVETRVGMASPLGVAISESDGDTLRIGKHAIQSLRLALAYQPVVLAHDASRVAVHEGLIRVLEPNG